MAPVRGAAAGGTMTVYSEQARGEQGAFPVITVYPGQGTTINFAATGKKIVKVWLDNPERLTLDTDGALCQGNGNCQDAGASMIHLNVIQGVDFPQIPNTTTTQITVVLEDSEGNRSPYIFTIRIGTGTPGNTLIAVRSKSGSGTGSGSGNPLRTVGVGSNALQSRLNTIERGLAIARQTGRISSQHGNLIVEEKVRQFLSLARAGVPVDQAYRRSAGVLAGQLQGILEQLEALGANEGRTIQLDRTSQN